MEQSRRNLCLFVALISLLGLIGCSVDAKPHRILLDTDVDTDDLFALLYLLKQNRSQFDLKAITVNSNAWADAGHAVNHLYDILYMMGRDDIPIGVGGDGGILDDGTILQDVGGYLPIIEQGMSTVGYCRYRQAVPLGANGRLKSDTNFGIRRSFLPQGDRKYFPLHQSTAQQVMIDTISAGPTTVFIIGAHTNFAFLLMNNPHLKKNIEHIYVMGGGVRSKNPAGCCPKIASTSCIPQQCGNRGNLFTGFSTNPYAEFNIFGDPFAAYQVFHSGIPITLVPLDATNTIPINKDFFMVFEQHLHTYEAQYVFQSLKMARDTWSDNQFYSDGYTKEITGPEAVSVLVAKKAKPNIDIHSPLNRAFFKSFLTVLNLPQHSGRFNFTTQFPYYKEVLYKPNFANRTKGKPVIFDMDMSAGDFLALIYLLKVPVEKLDLKGILVSGNGWANAATIDIVYDVLHMMGRDDLPVGLGNVTALGTPSLGCKYVEFIPHGSGGTLDSDTLFGLARSLPRSPRRYTAENSVKNGAPRNTDHPELRQPLAVEVWQSISSEVNRSDKITILTNGPLTNIANIILSDENASSIIEHVYVVGGHVINDHGDKGNVFTASSNRYAEFNFFLDPLSAKTIVESNLEITLLPLNAQRKVTSFSIILDIFQDSDKTPESIFVERLLSLMDELQRKHHLYRHMDTFLGEILGAVFLIDQFHLSAQMKVRPISVLASGNTTTDGQLIVDERNGKLVNILDSFDNEPYYCGFVDLLSNWTQSAVISSFEEQKRQWSEPPTKTGTVRSLKNY